MVREATNTSTPMWGVSRKFNKNKCLGLSFLIKLTDSSSIFLPPQNQLLPGLFRFHVLVLCLSMSLSLSRHCLTAPFLVSSRLLLAFGTLPPPLTPAALVCVFITPCGFLGALIVSYCIHSFPQMSPFSGLCQPSSLFIFKVLYIVCAHVGPWREWGSSRRGTRWVEHVSMFFSFSPVSYANVLNLEANRK